MYDKVVSLGSRLRYPITITKLFKAPGDSVKRQENIIEYKFNWRRQINDDEWVDETTYTTFDSPAEGTLKEWSIEEGMVVAADIPCMTVEEACGHEVQMEGLCSLCGADMTEINWACEGRDTDRAMVNMVHDQTGLKVSKSVAQKAEYDAQKRLLRQRKLSLVVDLDQTIIHACIEPTVGEWQSDPSNPNHNAVKDVKSFQLTEEGFRGPAGGATYYIKLRPGLMTFLEEISSMYEMHVYTMGTRAYALNIAKIVDPDKKLFGSRVISRDENGSIHAKSLQRLFPVSTDMVVIIDDRSDVWPMNRPNLIKVVPYDFFKGIGDINSSFLPKRQDILPAPAKPNGAAPDKSESSATPESKPSPLDELAKMGGEDIKVQTEEQVKTLEKQLKDRPMLHMQEQLDKEEEANDTEETSPTTNHRQNLLSDDDEELIALQDHLTDLHTAFYETYDRRRDERKQSEPKHVPGKLRKKSFDDGVDLSMVPDAGDLLDELKSNVLSGLVMVFSGLVPLGANVEESEIGMQAQSFGAQVNDIVTRRATHLVVSSSRPRTKKVQQAAKIPHIRIVNQNWLTDCLSQWRRLDERPYYVEILDADRGKSGDTTDAVSEEEEDGDSGTNANATDLIDFDWDEADKEIEDMLDSDDDSSEGGTDSGLDSETESNGTEESRKRGKKRKAETQGDDDSEDDTGTGESALAKKQRVARSRGASTLRSVRGPEQDGALPTPGPTGDEGEKNRTVEDEELDENAQLERDLLAEFEAENL